MVYTFAKTLHRFITKRGKIAGMSIHSFEIACLYPIDSKMEELMRAFDFTDEQIKQIQEINHEKSRAYTESSLTKLQAERRQLIGIRRASVSGFIDEVTGAPQYSFKLEIEPQVLLENRHTVDLYEPSERRNRELADAFHTAVNQFIDDDAFPQLVALENWNCVRMDYTHNFRFPDSSRANLFFRLTKRTSQQMKRRKPLLVSDEGKKTQSTAEGNKSSKVMFYQKSKQISEAYEGMPPQDLTRLLDAAKNVIRYEVQCRRVKVVAIQKKHGWSDHRIMRYLDAEVAAEVLYQSYVETIGTGEFYYFYEARKRIDASDLSTRLKHNIYNCMQLIAQARSLARGREQFVEGGHKLKNGQEVTGTLTTFRRYMRELEALNINPCMIPKDWRHTFGTHFHNPIDQLTAKESEEII